MCIVARCTVSRYPFIIVRRWLTSDRLNRSGYYSTIVRTYSDLSRGASRASTRKSDVWARHVKDRVVRNRSCPRYKNAPAWLHESSRFVRPSIVIDAWQVFSPANLSAVSRRTRCQIGCRNIKCYLDSCDARKEINARYTLLNARLYICMTISWNLLYSEKIVLTELIGEVYSIS